jgi:hypothetical protein
MPIEDNKLLVRRYFEDGPSNPDICDGIFAPRIRWHAINHTTGSPILTLIREARKPITPGLQRFGGLLHDHRRNNR